MAYLPDEYKGVVASFNGFTAAKDDAFSVRGQAQLALQVGCPVAILQSPHEKTVSVSVDADRQDLSQFRIYSIGDTVHVEQNDVRPGGGANLHGVNVRGSSININNTVIMGNVTIGGRAFSGNFAGANTSKTPRIIIRAPANSNLDASLGGQASLISALEHDHVDLHLAGQTKVGLAARHLQVTAAGQSEIKAMVMGGALRLQMSGTGSARVKGQFAQVDADLSGTGAIETRGKVTGDYNASASGVGIIAHRGPVLGRVHQRVSGIASINVGP